MATFGTGRPERRAGAPRRRRPGGRPEGLERRVEWRRLPERTGRTRPRPGRGRVTAPPVGSRGHRPRPLGRKTAWSLLAAALAALTAGIMLPDGLLLAFGIVAAGVAGHLFEPPP
ncbi:hypothetical protein J5J01_07890 [Streptomyces fradiae]|uniref:hypothetical protein n=1 Tax=Streptomyces fradiae TaxID=1906 RepID=UPI002019A3DF|nr:hypothetical protein [Streptomyces fradiae]UQS31546.1 hypothetical protein J5J01_07890 [Streptomyces fradiae]